MPDILSALAAQTGIDEATLQRLLGAVLQFFHSQLKPETYDKLASAIPQADELVRAHEERPGTLGSLASELATKFFNGSGQAGVDFMANLVKSGVPVEQATDALPDLFKVLAKHLPPEVVEKLRKSIPALPGIDMGKILKPEAADAASPAPVPQGTSQTSGASSDFV